MLARELGLPLDLPSAVKLLASPAAIRTIDAMRTDGRHFFTQIGVGLDALMIRDTPRESKKRFGRLAYLWTGLTRLLGHQPRRFAVHVGERRTSHRASEVLVANSGTLGQPPFRWGPDIRLDDARVNILIVRAKTLLDYGRLSWNFFRGRHRDDPNVRYLVAGDTIRIESDEPLPVQADGEIIGETPVTVEVVPAAVRVIVPSGKPAEKAPEG